MLTVSYSISHQKDPRAPTAITSTDDTDETVSHERTLIKFSISMMWTTIFLEKSPLYHGL